MKVALIFPPQWDPRHPPLCIPTLSGIFKSSGHQVRAWDINLYLYWQILLSSSLDKQTVDIIEQYLSAESLKDYKYFAKLNSLLEYEMYIEYDHTEKHQLYWDHMTTPYSPNKSKHWKVALRNPHIFPFFPKIKLALDEVVQWKPDVVLISCISDTQLFGTLSISSEIRSRLPYVKIVLGGHALAHRRSLLKDQDWLFDTIDAICISHGESTAIALSEGKTFDVVPNIIWHSNDGIQIQNKIESVDFPNSFEPDFSVLPLQYYLTPIIVIPIETARGCPWGKCSFCGHPQMQIETGKAKHYKIRPIDSVIREVSNHLSNGFRNFFFVDDAIPYGRFKELSNELNKIKEELRWICYLRLEQAHNMETFLLARESGCKKVFFGLETGSQRLMKLHRKGSTPHIAKRILKEASSADLAVHLFMIDNFPDESEHDRQATDEFLMEILPYVNPLGFTYDIFPLSAELETPLYANPTFFGAKGIRQSNNDLAYRFSLLSSKNSDKKRNSKSDNRIKAIIESCLKNKDGIRNLDLSHDAIHLLLI